MLYKQFKWTFFFNFCVLLINKFLRHHFKIINNASFIIYVQMLNQFFISKKKEEEKSIFSILERSFQPTIIIPNTYLGGG